MCKRCLKQLRRFPPNSITDSHAKILAIKFMNGESIPLFKEKEANLAVEAWIHIIECAKIDNKHKRFVNEDRDLLSF